MNKYFIFIIIAMAFSIAFIFLYNSTDGDQRDFQLPTSSTRTDNIPSQMLENGCYPALSLNGTYYEVCP